MFVETNMMDINSVLYFGGMSFTMRFKTGSIIKTITRSSLILLLLCALTITVMLYYFSHVELADDYRYLIEQRLSSAFQLPVSIGSGTLAFHRGLALDLQQINIGTDNDLRIEIPEVTATLLLLPLLNKEIVLKNVEILGARLQLSLPINGTAKSPPATSGTPGFGFEIRMLTLRNAEFELHRKDSDSLAKAPVLQLTNLHAVMYDWQAGNPSTLVMSGHETGSEADFLLETTLPAFFNLENWRFLNLHAQLQIGRFQTSPPLNGLAAALAQSGRIEMTLNGIPAEGAMISAKATKAGSSSPLLQTSGVWSSHTDEERLDGLTGSLLGFPVRGQLVLQHQPQKRLTAQFESTNLELVAEDFHGLELIELAGFQKGNLDHLLLRLEHTWTESTVTAQPIRAEGHFAVSALEWQNPQSWSIRALKSELDLIGTTLTFADMHIATDLGSITAAGEIHQIFSDQQLQLQAQAEPDLETLRHLLTLPDDWRLQGRFPLRLKLDGNIKQPAFELFADLTQNQLELGRFFTKTGKRSATVEMKGKLHQNQKVQLERFDIHLDPLRLVGQAQIQKIAAGIVATLTTNDFDLAHLASINPTFQYLQLRGKATTKVNISPGEWRGDLRIANGGAHLTSLIGDLNSVTGTVRLDRDGLYFDQLPANLGNSKFTVDGSLRNWSDPLLQLIVVAPFARAQDLVFLNQELTLYNLRGRLEIDRNGIRFDPVSVALEEATRATVFGSVTNFSRPKVDLSIHGDRADVLDIINLFRAPSARSTATKSDTAPDEPITIQVTAREGTLGGLKFTNARTTIIDHRGVLSVSPLTFESGGGWCRAKVEYNRHDPAAPLKISGHVNGVDASALHHDLLNRPGLIRGPVTGDFYLAGDPGNGSFWQQASGGLYFQVHHGTLRRFRGLAQVFSLLNVSQIFTGRLPDMDREGMPFNLLEGSVQIGAGMLHTDDLKITGEAMNMSVVGSQALTDEMVNLTLGVMPLRTVDKVVSAIPIAGWLLAGEDRAVLTAYFRIEGPSSNPTVTAVPVDSISNTVLGLFRRTLGLPEKLIKDFGSLLQPEETKKEEK